MAELAGKIQPRFFMVTGVTSGIGLAVARGLRGRGHAVIGAGRSAERCGATAVALQEEFPPARLAIEVADLSLQDQVRGLAAAIGGRLDEWGVAELDGLVNNAGTFTFWQTLTAEGFETQWAVNPLAPFLVTLELLPRLQASAGARVVTVSSGSHYGTRLDWADIQLMRRYNPLQAYKQTKLANVLFTAELNRRLGTSSHVRAVAADPGLVNTEMGQKANSRLARWIWSMRRKNGIPAERAAEGILSLLLEPEVLRSTEIYWKHGRPKAPDPAALDLDAGRRLWALSSLMCGLALEAEAA